MDTFGTIEGKERVQRGWLSDEMIVQLKLQGDGLVFWKKKFVKRRVWVKVVPFVKELEDRPCQDCVIDTFPEEDGHDIQDVRSKTGTWPSVESAALTEKDSVRKIQENFGIEYQRTEDSFVILEIQLLNLENVAFLVDLYTGVNMGAAEHIGMCYIYPEQLKHTVGKLQPSISSMDGQPIGTITIDYLLIHPIQDMEMDFSLTYRNYWAEDWNGLDVGHRGLGNSYTKGHHCSHIKENTVASMQDAIVHGADMVEFDVQVSKDLVPVVFHEFNLCVQTKSKDGGDVMLDVPVKDLSVAELQSLRSHHPMEKKEGLKNFGDDGIVDHESFPTLADVLQKLENQCGFNIEVKYGGLMKDGTEEAKHQMEMNLFVDQILKCVLKHGGERAIFFSSFHPDVCTMLINKQNRYPVLFLTAGENSTYEKYHDPRTWTIRNGVWFGEMAGLLGLSAMAEAVLADVKKVDLVRDKNKVLFVWTDETGNDRETVKYLKNLGVNGVIYDRIDQNRVKHDNKFFSELPIGGETNNTENFAEESPDDGEKEKESDVLIRKRSALSFNRVQK